MLKSGVHFNNIALYLGHETPATTHRYVEVDLAMKEHAFARLEEPPTVVPHHRPPDDRLRASDDHQDQLSARQAVARLGQSAGMCAQIFAAVPDLLGCE